jgi:hypothetical protein
MLDTSIASGKIVRKFFKKLNIQYGLRWLSSSTGKPLALAKPKANTNPTGVKWLIMSELTMPNGRKPISHSPWASCKEEV